MTSFGHGVTGIRFIFQISKVLLLPVIKYSLHFTARLEVQSPPSLYPHASGIVIDQVT